MACLTDAALELLRARSKLFAFNSNNAVLQFLLDVCDYGLLFVYCLQLSLVLLCRPHCVVSIAS